MLYLGIDQHAKQLTLSPRNEAGGRDPQPTDEHGTEADR